MEEQKRKSFVGGSGSGSGNGPNVAAYQRKITPSDKEAAVVDPWGAALRLHAVTPESLSRDIAQEAQEFALRQALFSGSEDCTTHGTGRRRNAGIGGIGAEAPVPAMNNTKRHDLIVVASLIDMIPNLAGLMRTCEVFRAQKLVLADLSVLNNPQFSTISVSAKHWQPVEEVHPLALHPWLRGKAAEGYTLVGLEQTADSTGVGEYVFPSKTVLLLGKEKEGVPADLLGVLDATVEIPQFGVIRSLNVHVSAAIGMYEYIRQQHSTV